MEIDCAELFVVFSISPDALGSIVFPFPIQGQVGGKNCPAICCIPKGSSRAPLIGHVSYDITGLEARRSH